MQLYSFNPTTASAVSDGVTTTANGATIVVGGAVPNKHALLRFDTSTIPSNEFLMEAVLTVKSSAVGSGSVPSLALWASDFGTSVVNADYGLPYTNSDPRRVPVSTQTNPILPSIAAAGTVGELAIPLQYLKTGAGAFSDFEIRPLVPTVGANDTMTINGPAAVTVTDRPTLQVYTLTAAEYSATDDDSNTVNYSLIDQLEGTPYRFYTTGAQSFVAGAREAKPGRPVKAEWILDASSIDLSQSAQTLFGDALTDDRAMPTKATYGAAAAGGSISFNVTPEKCMRLLTGFLKITQTVNNLDGTYTYTFKVAKSQEVAAFTFVVLKGPFYKVYRGSRLGSLSLSIGLNGIIRASISIGALEEWTYSYADAGVDAEHLMNPNAGYDTITNGVWSFLDGYVTIGGNSDDCIQDFNIEFNNSLSERRGLNGKRSAKGYHVGSFSVMTSFSTDMVNEKLLKRHLGVQAKGGAFKAAKAVTFDNVGIKVERADIKAKLEISVPKNLFESVSDGIGGPDEVKMAWRSMGLSDPSIGTPVIFTLTTPEPPTAFQGSTDYITVQPPEIQN